ncbi:MarR family winged helix-turn-helix transcriptional regulator [Guggenheimella bovis]
MTRTTLQRGQYIYLLYLQQNDGSNQYDISRDLFIDKTTVAKALKKMEDSGIISRRTDAHDKRKVNVHLTAKGKLLYNDVAKIANEVESMMIKNIASEHQVAFGELLTIFNDELDLHWCDIKNYKGSSVFNLASQEDYQRLQERSGLHLEEGEQIYAEFFDKYLLNWLRFSYKPQQDASQVEEMNFHSISDTIIDGMNLIKNFETWHFANHTGPIFVRIPDGSIDEQKLLHKNGYTFHHYDKTVNGTVLTYEKKKLK